MNEPAARLATDAQGETISSERYYAIIRGQIEHEDNLIGQRISWFVTAQSFFFTAYAIVMSNVHADHPHWVTDRLRLLVFLIPLAATCTCLLIYATIIAGLIAIRDLRRLYNDFSGLHAASGLPPVQGFRRTQLLGQAAPIFLPLVFLVIWAVLLISGPG